MSGKSRRGGSASDSTESGFLEAVEKASRVGPLPQAPAQDARAGAPGARPTGRSVPPPIPKTATAAPGAEAARAATHRARRKSLGDTVPASTRPGRTVPALGTLSKGATERPTAKEPSTRSSKRPSSRGRSRAGSGSARSRKPEPGAPEPVAGSQSSLQLIARLAEGALDPAAKEAAKKTGVLKKGAATRPPEDRRRPTRWIGPKRGQTVVSSSAAPTAAPRDKSAPVVWAPPKPPQTPAAIAAARAEAPGGTADADAVADTEATPPRGIDAAPTATPTVDSVAGRAPVSDDNDNDNEPTRPGLSLSPLFAASTGDGVEAVDKTQAARDIDDTAPHADRGAAVAAIPVREHPVSAGKTLVAPAPTAPPASKTMPAPSGRTVPARPGRTVPAPSGGTVPAPSGRTVPAPSSIAATPPAPPTRVAKTVPPSAVGAKTAPPSSKTVPAPTPTAPLSVPAASSKPAVVVAGATPLAAPVQDDAKPWMFRGLVAVVVVLVLGVTVAVARSGADADADADATRTVAAASATAAKDAPSLDLAAAPSESQGTPTAARPVFEDPPMVLQPQPLAGAPEIVFDDDEDPPPRRRRRRPKRTGPVVDTTPEPEPDEAAPEPAVAPPKRPPVQTAGALLREAKAALTRGDSKAAYRLAKKSYGKSGDEAAAALMARAACRHRNTGGALSALRLVRLLDRAAIRKDCRQNGVPIGL